VPKVEVTEQIFRCKFCAAYINSKFEIKFNKSSKRVIICNLCQSENELDPSKPGVKSEYFNSTITDVTELSYPTIDFNAPPNLKHSVNFMPHYIFLIDISHVSKEISFATYVRN
jgi:transcription elongation factor Elf1